tara:strand:- start:433 stop:1182 length:750 start_codon:yes stop_codon:yes gene_type:complete
MKNKIVGVYRIKNEERWIAKSLESISDICSEVVILDDGSTDKTVEICSKYDKVVDIYQQKDLHFDETRDRNLLLEMALKRKPDIILSMDGDEILMPFSQEILFEELDVLYPESSVFEFQFLTLWDKPNQVRFDGMYSNNWQKRLFRVGSTPRLLRMNETQYGGNAHCSSVPENVKGFNNSIRSGVKVFHYGSFDKNLRQQKYKLVSKIDPDNTVTHGYIHMIDAKGPLSGKHGFEFKTIPAKLTYNTLK